MSYSGLSPWPFKANGQGGTLELLDPYNDISSYYNWFDGCFGGSPGKGFSPCIVGMENVENTAGAIELEIYPNPFYHSANIIVSLKEETPVTVSILDLTGREVAVLRDYNFKNGRHYLRFTPDGLAPGIYYCRALLPAAKITAVMSYLGSN